MHYSKVDWFMWSLLLNFPSLSLRWIVIFKKFMFHRYEAGNTRNWSVSSGNGEVEGGGTLMKKRTLTLHGLHQLMLVKYGLHEWTLLFKYGSQGSTLFVRYESQEPYCVCEIWKIRATYQKQPRCRFLSDLLKRSVEKPVTCNDLDLFVARYLHAKFCFSF